MFVCTVNNFYPDPLADIGKMRACIQSIVKNLFTHGSVALAIAVISGFIDGKPVVLVRFISLNNLHVKLVLLIQEPFKR